MNDGLFPAWIYFYYQTEFGQHRMTVPVQTDGTAGSDSTLELKGGSVENWRVAAGTYSALIAACYPPQTTITYAELWWKVGPTASPTYEDTFELLDVGTNTNPSIKAAQITFSWRTNNGGNGRTVLMDCVYAPNQSVRPPFTSLGTPFTNLTTYILGATSPVIGRDNGKPVAGIRATTKTNDALRKRYDMV